MGLKVDCEVLGELVRCVRNLGHFIDYVVVILNVLKVILNVLAIVLVSK